MDTEIELKSLRILEILESWNLNYQVEVKFLGKTFSFNSFFNEEDIQNIKDYAKAPLPMFKDLYDRSLNRFHDKLYLIMFNKAELHCDDFKTELNFGIPSKNDPFIPMKIYLQIRNTNKSKLAKKDNNIPFIENDDFNLTYKETIKELEKMSEKERNRMQSQNKIPILEKKKIIQKNNTIDSQQQDLNFDPDDSTGLVEGFSKMLINNPDRFKELKGILDSNKNGEKNPKENIEDDSKNQTKISENSQMHIDNIRKMLEKKTGNNDSNKPKRNKPTK